MKTSRPFVNNARWLPAVIAALVVSASATVWANNKMYEDALPSTVWVLTKVAGKTSSGTGVLVDSERKLVVTNFHVVGEARNAIIFFPATIEGRTEVTRKHYVDNLSKLGLRGRVVAVDRKRDLGLIQLDRLPEGARAIPMAASSPKPGEGVASIGNPGSSDALWVYTEGTVRAVYKKQFRTGAGDHDFTVVETTSPINTGDSGGPVVNESGELVAISQAIAPQPVRLVSYSVDITEVRAFLEGPWKQAPLPVTDLLTAAELEFTTHSTGHYQVEFPQDDKQKQTVFISKDVEFYEKADNRKIWALAAKLKETPKLEVAMKLLDQNSRTKLGSWTIEQSDRGELLVIYMAKLDATAAADSVRSTMEYVAKLTTMMKKELTSADPKATAVSTSTDKLDDWIK